MACGWHDDSVKHSWGHPWEDTNMMDRIASARSSTQADTAGILEVTSDERSKERSRRGLDWDAVLGKAIIVMKDDPIRQCGLELRGAH